MAGRPTSGDVTDESFDADDTTQGISWTLLASAGIMALLVGGMAAWATSEIGRSGIAFVVAALISGSYLYQKPLPSAAVGTGLYITAGLAVLTPILIYVPMIFGAEEAATAEEAGTFIGSVLGLVIWGFVFFLIALVVFTLGYFSNKRAKKKLQELDTTAS